MKVCAPNSQFLRWTTIVGFSLALLAAGVVRRCTAEEPIATIAVVSNPYITTLPPDQIKQTNAKRHVFVVAHYPSLPSLGNNLQSQLGGTQVLSLLHEHRVTEYLFGHRHRNGFRMHERTAHVLTDNMTTIHLLHVFPDRIIVGRKRVGAPLYEKLVLPSPRS